MSIRSVFLLLFPPIVSNFILSPPTRLPTTLNARRNRPDTNKPPPSADAAGNWIDAVDSDDDVTFYDIGLNGATWKVGELAASVHAALPDAWQSGREEYALQFACTQAVEAALQFHGMKRASEEDDDLVVTDIVWQGTTYESIATAAAAWTVGDNVDFVVRRVAAQDMEWTPDTIFDQLDPDGSLRKEAAEAGIDWEGTDDSLPGMARRNKERSESTPEETDTIYAGDLSKRGYQVVTAKELAQGLEGEDLLESDTVLHVMNALVAHGCLLVDVSNGGQDMESVAKMTKLWETVDEFFQSDVSKIAPLQTATETGSPHAKVGYVNHNGLEFLETRMDYTSETVLPKDSVPSESVQDAVEILANIGRDATKIAIAASLLEMETSLDAVQVAHRVGESLVDDWTNRNDDAVSLTPFRLCRYANQDSSSRKSMEVFGAHTDTSFMTLVPVSKTPGLEVFDESTERWYRPELAAREYDEKMSSDGVLPWNARYVVAIPGEMLQILTQHEVEAAVHRVVVADDIRYSAPLLLRGRPNGKLEAKSVWGEATSQLAKECDGKSMLEIHAAMQA